MIDPCHTCGARLVNAPTPQPPPQPPPQPQPQPMMYAPQPAYYPPVYAAPVMYAQTPMKSKTTAALLCFCLGGLGIHRFYTGQVGLGIAILLQSLILTPLTLGLWSFVVLIWVVVDFIMILSGSVKDSQGRPLI